jgi:hypothetical protein
MRIYSKATESFLKKLRPMLVQILEQEMKLNFKSKRVLFKNYYYPINLVVFEGGNKLGYFDYRTFTIALNKRLMFEAKTDVIKDILRHELAHFYCYLDYGLKEIHGEDFKNVCRLFKWNETVIKASSSVEIENQKYTDSEFDKIQERLKKLLSLQSSSNIHEAELATMKANELIIEYNLSAFAQQKSNSEDEESYVDVILEGNKKNAKHSAIYDILKTFYVAPVFNMSKGSFQLEVVGSKNNIELAKYVAGFLDLKLDELYESEKLKNPKILKGLAAKNAFLKGIGMGYVEKIEHAHQSHRKGNELILLKYELQKQISRVYPRLGSSYSSAGFGNSAAKDIGITAGKNLSINPAIKNSNTKTFLLGLIK